VPQGRVGIRKPERPKWLPDWLDFDPSDVINPMAIGGALLPKSVLRESAERALEKFRSMLTPWMGSSETSKTIDVLSKYPRVVAHSDPTSVLLEHIKYAPDPIEKILLGFLDDPNPAVRDVALRKLMKKYMPTLGRVSSTIEKKPPYSLYVNPRFGENAPKFIPNVITEELTHIAQNIGKGGKLGLHYNPASARFSYDYNPYEVTAAGSAIRRFPKRALGTLYPSSYEVNLARSLTGGRGPLDPSEEVFRKYLDEISRSWPQTRLEVIK